MRTSPTADEAWRLGPELTTFLQTFFPDDAERRAKELENTLRYLSNVGRDAQAVERVLAEWCDFRWWGAVEALNNKDHAKRVKARASARRALVRAIERIEAWGAHVGEPWDVDGPKVRQRERCSLPSTAGRRERGVQPSSIRRRRFGTIAGRPPAGRGRMISLPS